MTRPAGMARYGAARPSAWRFFPHAVCLAFAALILGDGVMVWRALATFPGETRNGFDVSNGYNIVLDRVAAQQALGWTVEAEARGGQVLIALVDRAGKPVPASRLAVVTYRMVGPEDRTGLRFVLLGAGRWLSRDRLGLGQWALDIRTAAGGHDIAVTRRVFVP